MSDGFSYSQADIDEAKAKGFADPDHARRAADADRQNEANRQAVADAIARGDDCEARIMSGEVTADAYSLEERQQRSQVETMFSGSNLTPWHRLPSAKVLPGSLTSVEALAASGLDWRVRTEEVQIVSSEWRREGQTVPAVALVRDSDGKVLGAGGRRYTPLQNLDLFAIGAVRTMRARRLRDAALGECLACERKVP